MHTVELPELPGSEDLDLDELEEQHVLPEILELVSLDVTSPALSRPQSRLVLAGLVLWYLCVGCLITLFNKWLISSYNFDFPITIILVCLVLWAGC